MFYDFLTDSNWICHRSEETLLLTTAMCITHGCNKEYHQTSNIRHTLVGDKIVDHSDVVGASPVGAAPTPS